MPPLLPASRRFWLPPRQVFFRPTFSLLASWIIDLGASSHMTETSSLLSSYHPSPSHPRVTIADGQPCLVQGRGTTRVTPSLSLHQILDVSSFLVNLLSISAITHALPRQRIGSISTITFFPFHYIFRDLYTGQRIGSAVRTVEASMRSLLMNPHWVFKLFFLHLLLLSPFCGIAV